MIQKKQAIRQCRTIINDASMYFDMDINDADLKRQAKEACAARGFSGWHFEKAYTKECRAEQRRARCNVWAFLDSWLETPLFDAFVDGLMGREDGH